MIFMYFLWKYVKTYKNGRKQEERPQKKKNVPKTIKTAGIIVILIAPLSHASIPAPEISGALLWSWPWSSDVRSPFLRKISPEEAALTA